MTMLIAAVLAFFVQDENPLQEVQKLRGEIQVLKTLNTLELTDDQMKQIVELADKTAKDRKDLVESSEDGIKELTQALKAVRDALRKGEKDVSELEKKVGEIQQGMGQTMQMIHQAGQEYGQGVLDVLTDEQKKKAAKFGQPNPFGGLKVMLSKIMENVRENPEVDLYENLGDPIYNQVERLTKGLKMDADSIEKETVRILDILEAAVQEEDDDKFKKTVENSLKKIFEEGKIGEASKKLNQSPPQKEGDLARRLGYVFNNPQVLKALRERIE